jgi:hypothetical protein
VSSTTPLGLPQRISEALPAVEPGKSMPDALRLVRATLEATDGALVLTWKVVGNSEAKLPTRPPTYGFTWAMSLLCPSMVYEVSVNTSRDARGAHVSPRHRDPIRVDPAAGLAPVNDPDFSGSVVSLELVEADLPGWDGGRVDWSASTRWDRYDIIDEHRTSLVNFETDRTPEDDLPAGFPIPAELRGRGEWSENGVRFQCWGGAARSVAQFFEANLPASGYEIGQPSQTSQPSPGLPMEWRSTRLPLRKDAWEGMLVLSSWVSIDSGAVSELVVYVVLRREAA